MPAEASAKPTVIGRINQSGEASTQYLVWHDNQSAVAALSRVAPRVRGARVRGAACVSFSNNKYQRNRHEHHRPGHADVRESIQFGSESKIESGPAHRCGLASCYGRSQMGSSIGF